MRFIQTKFASNLKDASGPSKRYGCFLEIQNLHRVSTSSVSQVNDFKNRIANVFYQNGFKHGDKVGLLMENRPEFVATWLVWILFFEV